MRKLCPLDKSVQDLIRYVLPRFIIESLEIVPSGRLHRLYLARASDDTGFILSLSPPTGMRLLRIERASIESEAAVLRWLSEISQQPLHKDEKMTEGQKRVTCSDLLSLEWSNGATFYLHRYLPKLVEHGSTNLEGLTLYNLTIPSPGTTISSLAQPLSADERKAVEFQIGQLLRRLSLHLSPNMRFGNAGDILHQKAQNLETGPLRFRGGIGSQFGYSCWSRAFHVLLESVLRDAEDFTITISYHCIRRHFKRFEHILDCITRSCLVAVDIGEDINTQVLRYGARSEFGRVTDWGEGNLVSERVSQPVDALKQVPIKVTGLREWSYCIFGDPLIATAFSNNPSPDFLHGVHRPLLEEGKGLIDYSYTLVEGQRTAHIRLLLYECYHAVCTIVKEFYRRRDDSDKREMAARKKLRDALAKLNNFDDEGNLKHEGPTEEMSPAKRHRSEVRTSNLHP